MKIDLDGILLNETQEQPDGSILAGRSVSNISTADKRNVVSYEAPGAQGSTHNDLGRSAVVISFDGTISGDNARAIIESIRSKFKAGEPLPFLSDLTGAADITRVLIDRFVVKDTAGSPDRYDYTIILKEYKEPPEEPEAPSIEGEASEESDQDGAAEDWAEAEAEECDEGVNAITGRVLDSEGNPKKGVKVTVKFGDGEYSAETDDDGVYRLENLEPGEYTATVEEEGYEGSEAKLTIGKENPEEGTSE
jgi:hypothetical protein